MFKKLLIFKVPVVFWSENFAAHEPLSWAPKFSNFFYGLIKIYLIGSIVRIFENRKKYHITRPCWPLLLQYILEDELPWAVLLASLVPVIEIRGLVGGGVQLQCLGSGSICPDPDRTFFPESWTRSMKKTHY